MTKVKSMKGKTLDLTTVMAQNEKSIAIGNAKMNARGDILGPGGQIIKRKEQVAQEYHATNPRAVQKISLKDVEPDVFLTPAEAVAKVKADLTDQKAGKKKIIDKDQ